MAFKVLLTVLAISWLQPGHAELNKNNGIMIPSGEYQIVDMKSNVTITCMFIHNASIIWTLPKVTTTAVRRPRYHYYCYYRIYIKFISMNRTKIVLLD
jgi:hypothetical protein